jgi:hypothetical protein
MAKRQKATPFDGLGPHERKRIDSAIRKVWYQSKPRQTCVKRCTDKEGFTWCEKCDTRTAKIKIDHIIACGPVDSDGFIKRLFCTSKGLQGLCGDCHQLKTNRENEEKCVSSDIGVKRRRKTSFMDS